MNLTDGRVIEVRHPELVLLNRRSAIVGIPAPEEPEPFYERRITVDLLHIVSLEPVRDAASPNGQ
jgi:hypothetical protein